MDVRIFELKQDDTFTTHANQNITVHLNSRHFQTVTLFKKDHAYKFRVEGEGHKAILKTVNDLGQEHEFDLSLCREWFIQNFYFIGWVSRGSVKKASVFDAN